MFCIKIILLYHRSGSIDNKERLNYNEPMKKSTKKLIILLAAAVVLCLAVFFLIVRLAAPGTIAVISVDSREYKRIDLSRVKEPYELTIKTEYGSNTVLVEPGAISVSSADCPDRICVFQGRLTQSGVPIICMPHRLIIWIEGEDIDAWS